MTQSSSNALPKEAWYLGCAGLIPFISLPLSVVLDLLSYSLAAHYFTLYSAIILSFLGGVLWFSSLVEKNTQHMIYVAMLPSIMAWLALILLPISFSIPILSVCFVGLIFYEQKFLLMPESLVKEYTRLRWFLTIVVTGAHFIMTLVD